MVLLIVYASRIPPRPFGAPCVVPTMPAARVLAKGRESRAGRERDRAKVRERERERERERAREREGERERERTHLSLSPPSERMSDGARQPLQMWCQNRSLAHRSVKCVTVIKIKGAMGGAKIARSHIDR